MCTKTILYRVSFQETMWYVLQINGNLLDGRNLVKYFNSVYETCIEWKILHQLLLGGTLSGTHQPHGLTLELGLFSTFILDLNDGIKNPFIFAFGGA